MQYRPAASAPAMAPAVLLPYSTAADVPSRAGRHVDDLSTNGRVAPMRAVGTSSTANEILNRMKVADARLLWSGREA